MWQNNICDGFVNQELKKNGEGKGQSLATKGRGNRRQREGEH